MLGYLIALVFWLVVLAAAGFALVYVFWVLFGKQDH